MVFSGYLALSVVGILVGFLAWRWLKDKVYLHYALYTLSIMAMALFGGFLISKGAVPSEFIGSFRQSLVFATLVNYAYFFFLRSLVRPQDKMPWLYQTQILVLAFLTLADVLTFLRTDSESWNVRGQILLAYTLVNMAIQIRAAFSMPFVRWYVVGGICFLLGNIPFVLLNAGAIQALTPTTGSLPFIGVLFETLFFILGLLDRLRYEYFRNVSETRVKMLGIAAAEIFHEIATPLTIIALNANKLRKRSNEIFRDDNESIEFHLLAENIDKNARRISSNVDKFRTFTGVQDRGIKPQKFVAREVIDGASDLFRRKVESKGCQFILNDEIASDILLEGNKFDLEQVIANLVNNSADAIQKHEEKWIELSTSLNGSFIEIHVSDSGRGIPKAIQEKIFNEFFTTKSAGEGSGLGLSICKRFAEAHGGYLKLDTRSENTKFILRLPVVENQM